MGKDIEEFVCFWKVGVDVWCCIGVLIFDGNFRIGLKVIYKWI